MKQAQRYLVFRGAAELCYARQETRRSLVREEGSGARRISVVRCDLCFLSISSHPALANRSLSTGVLADAISTPERTQRNEYIKKTYTTNNVTRPGNNGLNDFREITAVERLKLDHDRRTESLEGGPVDQPSPGIGRPRFLAPQAAPRIPPNERRGRHRRPHRARTT